MRDWMWYSLALTTILLVALGYTSWLYLKLLSSRMRAIPSLVNKTVIVNTMEPGSVTIRGVVHDVDDQYLVLREAAYLSSSGGSTVAAGFVTVPQARIATMQEPS